RRDSDPEAFTRPAATLAEIIPADMGGARQAALAASASAADRFALAERRLAEARRLTAAQQQVIRVEAEAGQLQATADEDTSSAEQEAAKRDTTAIALAQAWRAWVNREESRELLGANDWAGHPAVGPLILDAEALTGEGDGSLAGLDEAAGDAARPAYASVGAECVRLDLDEDASQERTNALLAERADLAAARDPKPDDPPWLATERAGEPLWRCVDFGGHMTGADQAGLEAALLASGLLNAVIQPDGSVAAADGELLLSPGVSRPSRPLSAAL